MSSEDAIIFLCFHFSGFRWISKSELLFHFILCEESMTFSFISSPSLLLIVDRCVLSWPLFSFSLLKFALLASWRSKQVKETSGSYLTAVLSPLWFSLCWVLLHICLLRISTDTLWVNKHSALLFHKTRESSLEHLQRSHPHCSVLWSGTWALALHPQFFTALSPGRASHSLWCQGHPPKWGADNEHSTHSSFGS